MTLQLVPVEDDMTFGAPIASAHIEGNAVIYYGVSTLNAVVDGMCRRWGMTEREAYDRLDNDGWSNGKISILGDGGS